MADYVNECVIIKYWNCMQYNLLLAKYFANVYCIQIRFIAILTGIEYNDEKI